MSEPPFSLPAPDLKLERVHSQMGAMVLALRATGSEALCPTCGRAAYRVQRSYRHTLADLPCQGVPVRLHLLVRRFRCEQTDCSRAIFSERCPERAKRRTNIGTWTDHDNLLRTRWNEGCRDAAMLFRELVQQGFRGTLRTVQRHVTSWRRVDDPHEPAGRAPSRATTSTEMRAPSPRNLRWWLLTTAAAPNSDPANGKCQQV